MRRSHGAVIITAAAGGLVATSLLLGLLPNPFTVSAKAVPGSSSSSATTSECASTVHYYSRAASSDKESKYAFGTDPRSSTVKTVSQLRKVEHARICRDPSLAASIWTTWEKTVFKKSSYDKIDSLTASYLADRDSWRSAVAQIKKWESASVITPGAVPEGYFSLYAKPSGDTVTIRQGETTKDGYGIFYGYKGETVLLRIDCGFQPSQPLHFPKVPYLPTPSKTPVHTTPSSTTPSSHPTPTPTKTPVQKCKYGKPWHGMCPKSTNPNDGYAPPPTNHSKATASGSGDATPSTVATTSTSNSGVTDSSSSSAPGSETGGTAPGATPVPSSSTSSAPPVDQGGTSNGTVNDD